MAINDNGREWLQIFKKTLKDGAGTFYDHAIKIRVGVNACVAADLEEHVALAER